MSDFKIGDVVMLKSGGPKMTVNHVIGDENGNKMIDSALMVQGFKKGDVNCEWFDGGESKKMSFKKETVEIVE